MSNKFSEIKPSYTTHTHCTVNSFQIGNANNFYCCNKICRKTRKTLRFHSSKISTFNFHILLGGIHKRRTHSKGEGDLPKVYEKCTRGVYQTIRHSQKFWSVLRSRSCQKIWSVLESTLHTPADFPEWSRSREHSGQHSKIALFSDISRKLVFIINYGV